jgi:hypothetical protein
MAKYVVDDEIQDLDFRKGEMDRELAPFDQIAPTKSRTIRIALLTEYCRPKAAPYHFYRDKFLRCNSPKDGPDAECCQHVQRSWTCVCLAVQYLNADRDGKLAPGSDIKHRVGYISLAKTAYAQLSEYQNEAPGCDLLYSKGDDDHYHFNGASSTPRWKQSPQREKVTADAMRWADGVKLTEKLGKKLSDVEWHRLIKTGTTLPEEEE